MLIGSVRKLAGCQDQSVVMCILSVALWSTDHKNFPPEDYKGTEETTVRRLWQDTEQIMAQQRDVFCEFKPSASRRCGLLM